MNGRDRLLVDTDLLIFLLDGNQVAARILQGKSLFYSFITEIELPGVPGITNSQIRLIESVLSGLTKIAYTDDISRVAIAVEQKQKVKVPDAIIAATAIEYDLPLFTADKGFKSIIELECILFEL